MTRRKIVAVATNAGREAWELMSSLFFSGDSHDRFHRASNSIGVSPGVMKGLLHLEPGVGVPMRDIANHFGCDASYVTSLVDGLEEKGYAKRQPHPTDRRVRTIVLTPKGAKAKAKALAVLHEPPASFNALNAMEQRALRDLFRKVLAADDSLNPGLTTTADTA
jgi:DNA-binding MarR family transcriptional regulator